MRFICTGVHVCMFAFMSVLQIVFQNDVIMYYKKAMFMKTLLYQAPFVDAFTCQSDHFTVIVCFNLLF